MSKHSARYVTLESIVDSYLDEAELSDVRKRRLYGIAYRGYEHIMMSFAEQPETRRFEVSANKIVELPDNFKEWVKVGVLNGDGEIVTLRENRLLTRYSGTSEDRLSLIVGPADQPQDMYLNYYDAQNNTYSNVSSFGNPGGLAAPGEFNIDYDENILLLDPEYAYDHVMVEMLVAPDKNQTVYVPRVTSDAIHTWIAWKDIAVKSNSRRVNQTDKRDRRHEYFEARRLARQAMRVIRPWSFNDSIRIPNRISLKS